MKITTTKSKVPSKFTWTTTFRTKWQAIVINELWPAKCPNVPLIMNFTSDQWAVLFAIFKSDFETQYNISIKKTCSKKDDAMKQIIGYFNNFFENTSNVEKLFTKTKELLNSVPAQQRAVAMQTENNFLKDRQISGLQATATTVYNQLVQNNTFKTNESLEQQDSKGDPVFDQAEFVEACLDMTEQHALQKFESGVQQKKFGNIDPLSILDNYSNHLMLMEQDIKEKKNALQLLTSNWKKRQALLKQQAAQVQQSTSHQSLTMEQVMNMMSNMIAPLYQQVHTITLAT